MVFMYFGNGRFEILEYAMEKKGGKLFPASDYGKDEIEKVHKLN